MVTMTHTCQNASIFRCNGAPLGSLPDTKRSPILSPHASSILSPHLFPFVLRVFSTCVCVYTRKHCPYSYFCRVLRLFSICLFVFICRAACWFYMQKKNSLCSEAFSVANEQDCRAAYDCVAFHDAQRSAVYPDVFYVRSDAHSPKGCIRQDLGHRGGVWLWNSHPAGGTPSKLVNPICLKGNQNYTVWLSTLLLLRCAEVDPERIHNAAVLPTEAPSTGNCTTVAQCEVGEICHDNICQNPRGNVDTLVHANKLGGTLVEPGRIVAKVHFIRSRVYCPRSLVASGDCSIYTAHTYLAHNRHKHMHIISCLHFI